MMVAVALLVFPKLALGMSGFETGVAVMPTSTGDRWPAPMVSTTRPVGAHPGHQTAADHRGRDHERLPDRQSASSPSCLIPADEFEAGGQANGRALAYLAHRVPRRRVRHRLRPVHHRDPVVRRRLRNGRACSTSIPRYLPRYGMAPHWARAVRPLVLVLTSIAFLVTWLFRADVNAQGGAYATGVLVLITSAAIGGHTGRPPGRPAQTHGGLRGDHCRVPLHDRRQHHRTTRRREDRCLLHRRHPHRLARVPTQARFRASRHRRQLDETASLFIRDCARRTIRLIANEPDERDKLRVRREDQADPPTTTTYRTIPTSSLWRSRSRTRQTSRPGSTFTATCCTSRYRVLTLERPRSPTRSPRCCCTCATRPPSPRTSTSNGPKATPCRTSCGSCSSASVRSPRSPARCSAGPSRIATVDPTSTSDDRRTMNP